MNRRLARGHTTAVARTVIGLALVAVVWAIYGQTRSFEFLTWDDHGYVTGSRQVARGLTWEGLRWAFTTTHVGTWVPLTWISHMAAVQVFGLDAGAHHLVNAALHAASALLLCCAVELLTGSRAIAAGTALLFAAHPLHVESVAWISERKDTLSGLWFVLALWAYARYVRRPGPWRFRLLLSAYLLGSLAKPMLVTLPLLLLCLDWWPLGRLGGSRLRAAAVPARCLAEKAPLLAIAATHAAVTLIWQARLLETRSLADFPPGLRLANAAVSLSAYLGDAILPAGLSPFYVYPAVVAPGHGALSALLVLGACVLVWRLRNVAPALATGWLWLLTGLLPVIGLVQAGWQARADRYVYLPMIGVYLAACASVARLVAGRVRLRLAAGAAAAGVLTALGAISFVQTGYWRDTDSLFRHALSLDAENWMAHEILGNELAARGDAVGALAHFEVLASVRPDPKGAIAFQLGYLYARAGRPADAERVLRRSLAVGPRSAEVHSQLANALAGLGRNDEAIAEYHEALRLEPGLWFAHYNLAQVLSRLGRLDEAVAQMRAATEARADSPEAWSGLGSVFFLGERYREAEEAFGRALALRPGDEEIHVMLRRSRQRAGGRDGTAADGP